MYIFKNNKKRKCVKWNYIPHNVHISKNRRSNHFNEWFSVYNKDITNMFGTVMDILSERVDIDGEKIDEHFRLFTMMIYNQSSKYIL